LISQVALAAAARRVPVVVVVMSGGPVDLSLAKSDVNVGAIVWCGYPGQSGGTAIADAIFGTTNPSAKLTMTWYPESLAKQVAITDMGMRPNATSGNPGRSYRFYTGTPVYKFGHGLSYTSFHSRLVNPPAAVDMSRFATELRLSPLSKRTAAIFSVRVTNEGDRDGAEVLQLFATPPNAGVDGRPLQSLVAFERVALHTGEEQEVELHVEASHFTLADSFGNRYVPNGTWKVWVGVDGESDAVSVHVQ